ncbi:MAG: sensor histidine kinase [Anaerolineales bacterium]|nr:sensor histidine kinase [Anaerolineales bacterium]
MKLNQLSWRQRTLVQRVRWLRYIVPPALAVWVVVYQLGFAQALENAYGSVIHYGVEIAFYSLVGPLVTWLTLTWVERNLVEKNRLAQAVLLAQREKSAVLEEDRARIARDLHDGVAQTLYFLALKADLLRQGLKGDEAAVELQLMGQTTRQVIREVRRTIFALQPLDWSPGGFVPALRQFVMALAEQTGWQATVTVTDHIDELPPHLEPIIFRLVQESLINVAKHAEAETVTVALTWLKNGRVLELTIYDNGQGFDPSRQTGHGFGLKQMAARVQAVGGQFQIDSQPLYGTTVQARLMLSGENHV